jgi:hypothetical protein
VTCDSRQPIRELLRYAELGGAPESLLREGMELLLDEIAAKRFQALQGARREAIAVDVLRRDEGLTIEAACERVGISAASFYRHRVSKSGERRTGVATLRAGQISEALRSWRRTARSKRRTMTRSRAF